MSDPRSIVTPDAFDVDPELLGLPLAGAGRRLLAAFVDLIVIGIVTAVMSQWSLLLGVVVAVLFVGASTRKLEVREGGFGRVMRLSLGCFGVFIGLMTALVWAFIGFGGADRVEEALEAELGDVRDVDDLVARLEAFEEGGGDPPDEAVAPDSLGASVDSLGTAEALRELAELTPDEPDPRAALLRRRVAADLAGDTIAALERRVTDLAQATDVLEDRLERTREALEQERAGGGFFAWIADMLDQLGFGFGWASLYMTVVTSWWRGQTVGKKLLGLRVRRLDGGPITWWIAFERVGGYAAGVATGLLGFAQVLWDANRQAIHDRIVGTVVILDGRERIGTWEPTT